MAGALDHMINYLSFLLVFFGVYALLSLCQVVVWGRSGMINLGITGFYAVGAYSSAILVKTWHLPIAVGWIASVAVAGLSGAVLCMVTRSLRGDYLAVVSLGFAEVVRVVATNESWLTNGSDGISGIPAPFKAEWGAAFAPAYAALTLIVVAIASVLVNRVLSAPFGRVLRGIRDDAQVVDIAGKNSLRFKVQSFAMGAALAGFAGAIYAHFTSYIVPDSFSMTVTIYVFLAVTAGGKGRVLGGILGAFAITVFLELSRSAVAYIPHIDSVQAASLREAAIGILLLLILRFRPEGMLQEPLVRVASRAAEDRGSAPGAPDRSHVSGA